MPTQVQIEGIGQVEFPDSMSESDIASTIAGQLPNWRQSFETPEPPSFGKQIADVAKSTGKAIVEPIRAIGQSVGYAGGLTAALAKDVMAGNVLPSTQRPGILPNLENVGAFMAGKEQPAEQTLTPVQKGIAGGARMLPALGLTTLGQLAGVPANITFPALAGSETYAETGSPIAALTSAGIAAVVPGLQKAGMEGAAKVTSNLIKRFAERATGDVEEGLARTLTQSRVAQKAVETAVGNATVQAYLSATQLPEFLQASPEKKEEMLAAAATQFIGFSLLQLPYFKGSTLSRTQQLIQEDVPFVLNHVKLQDPAVIDKLARAALDPRNAQVFQEARQNLPQPEGIYAAPIRPVEESNQQQHQGASPQIQSVGIDRNVAPVEPQGGSGPVSSDSLRQGGQTQEAQAQPEVLTLGSLTPDQAIQSGADRGDYFRAVEQAFREGKITEDVYKSNSENDPTKWPQFKVGQKVYVRGQWYGPAEVSDVGYGWIEVRDVSGQRSLQSNNSLTDLNEYRNRHPEQPITPLAPTLDANLAAQGITPASPESTIEAAITQLVKNVQDNVDAGVPVPPALEAELGIVEKPIAPFAYYFKDKQTGEYVPHFKYPATTQTGVKGSKQGPREKIESLGMTVPAEIPPLSPENSMPAFVPPVAPSSQPVPKIEETTSLTPPQDASPYELQLRQRLASNEAFKESNRGLMKDNPRAFIAEEQTRLAQKASILKELKSLPRTIEALRPLSRGQVEALYNDGKITDALFYEYAKEWNKAPRFGRLMPEGPVTEPPTAPTPTVETPTAQAVQNYEVVLRFQHPAHDEKDGILFEVQATNKSDAIKYARREADKAGHLVGGKGRVSFKANLSGATPSKKLSGAAISPWGYKDYNVTPEQHIQNLKTRIGQLSRDLTEFNKLHPNEPHADRHKLQLLREELRQVERANINAAQVNLEGTPQSVDSKPLIDQALSSGGGDAALRAVVPQLRIRYGPLAEGVPMDYENGVITINKPLLDRIAARWPNQAPAYISRLLGEELIHAVADRVVPPEDFVSIAQDMPANEQQRMAKLRPEIADILNTQDRLYTLGAEYFRAVLQRELQGGTTEEALPPIDVNTTFGQRILAALRRVWDYLRNLIAQLGPGRRSFVLEQALERVRQTLDDVLTGKPLKAYTSEGRDAAGPLNAKAIKDAIATFTEKAELPTMRVAQAGEVVAANPTARKLVAETQEVARGPEKTVQATTTQERLRRDIARATLNQPIIRDQLVGPIDTLNLSMQIADENLATFESVRRDPNATDAEVSAAAGNALDTIRSLDSANQLFTGEYAKERPLLVDQIGKLAEKELSAMDQRDVDGTLFEQFKELGHQILDQTADVAGLKALSEAQLHSTATLKVLKFLRETQVLEGLQWDDNRSIDDLIGYIRNYIVNNTGKFKNYNSSQPLESSIGAGEEAIRDVLRIVRLSEPLRTDIAESRDVAAGTQYAQPFHRIKERVLADIAKGNLASAHNLYEHGLVETGITLKESRDNANFYARRLRQALVQVKALDGAKEIIDRLNSDPDFVSQKRTVQEYMGVKDRTITKDIGGPVPTDWYDDVDLSKPKIPIVWERTLADREANVKRAQGLYSDYMAYVGNPDAPGYDAGRAEGMKRALEYLKYYLDPSQDLALGRLVPGGIVKAADHISAVFGHPMLIPKYSFVGATGPAYTNFNLTMVALSDVLERSVAIEKQYAGRRKKALGEALASHQMTLPVIYQQEILNPLAASRQNFNDAHVLKVGDGIGNGHVVTREDIEYYKIIEKFQNELLQVVNNYGRHKFESAGKVFAGVLMDSGKQVRMPYAHGPNMLPRRFPDQLGNWILAWKQADTPEKKVDFLNQHKTRFIISYIDGVGQSDFDHPYAYRLPMKEVMRTKGHEPIKNFEDLVTRIVRLHNEDRDNTPITLVEARDTMLGEIGGFLAAAEKLLPSREASEKQQMEITGGDSEFNAERKQAVMPLGMYDYGVVTDADVAGALRGASWSYVNAHLNAARALQEGFQSDSKKFESDAAQFGTKTVKQQASEEAAHGKRLYDWGQVDRLKELLSNYLTQIQTAVHLSANPFMMDRPHQVLQNSLAKLMVTSLVAAPSPLVRNLAGGFAQIAAFNAEVRRLAFPWTAATGQAVAGTFKELMFLLTHEGNPATRKLRSFLESPEGRSLTLGVAKWVMDMANERRDLHDYTSQIAGINLNQKFWENTKGNWALWRTKGVAAGVMPPKLRQWLNGVSLGIDTLANFIGHATVGYGDSRINSASVYLTEKAEREFEEIAMRWGDKRMPNGLYPDQALARRLFGLAYGTATPATRIREWFRNSGIGPIDQLMDSYYQRVKAWEAAGSHGQKPILFSDPQFVQMVMANAEDENLSTFRSRPPLFKQSKLHSTLGILFGYPFYLLRKLLSFTHVMNNQSFLRRHGEAIPLALTIAVIMGLTAILGNEVAAKLIKRGLEGKVTGFPTLSDATTPQQAAQAALFATADSVPIIGSTFNMLNGVGYTKGFDLNSQFLMVNLASDIMKTSKEMFQTGDIGRPMLNFAQRYTFPANVLGSRLPISSGLRDFTNARNILVMGSRGTGLETKLRKPGSGTQNYSASTPLVNDAINAIGNNDTEGFQKAFNALMDQKRRSGSLNPHSAALTALKARSPIASVFGTRPQPDELARVLSNLPPDLSARAQDTIRRFDTMLSSVGAKTGLRASKGLGRGRTRAASNRGFGLRRGRLRMPVLRLKKPRLRRLVA